MHATESGFLAFYDLAAASLVHLAAAMSTDIKTWLNSDADKIGEARALTLLGGMSWLSAIIPTSNAAGLIRYYFGLLPLTQEAVLIRWLILIVTTVVFIVLTSAKAKWRET